MKRIFIILLILGTLMLISACAPENVQGLVDELGAQVGERSGEIDTLAEGRGPIEITPGSGNERTTSSDVDEGVVSSSGEEIASRSVSSEPMIIGSSSSEGSSEKEPVNWLTYTDEAFKFSVNYPDTYTILPEIDLLRNIDPELIHRVRFQRISLAKGDTAEYEIPKFVVEVYELDARTLEAFLDNQPSGVEIEVYTQGDLTGFRVIFNQLIAPNEFFYFSGNGYVYKLTPTGVYSEEMLHSFQLLQ